MTWLEEYILKHYKPEHGSKTPLEGNCNDVFEDGVDYGWCFALRCVATMIGMDVPDPDIPDLNKA